VGKIPGADLVCLVGSGGECTEASISRITSDFREFQEIVNIPMLSVRTDGLGGPINED
jgi:hypothetical protein